MNDANGVSKGEAPPAAADEFVTVAEASKRLQIALRTAQRYAAKLAQSDTTLAAGGAVRLVRLSSMTRQAEQAKRSPSQNAGASMAVSDTTAAQDDTTHAPPDATVAQDAKDSAATPGTIDGALVAQLQAENARLWAALEREQANVAAVTGELKEARRESQVLIMAAGAGRLHLPPYQAEPMQTAEAARSGEHEQGPARNEAPEAPQSPHTEETTGTGQSVKPSVPSPWWAFWKTKEGR